MWLERIIEAKKAQGITPKMMSERIGGHLPERTIARILNGSTEFPRVDTIIELGRSVGLSAQEIFAETNLVVSDHDAAALREQLEAQKAHNEECIEELKEAQTDIALLNDRITHLTYENNMLKKELEHKDEVIALYKEIISLHNHKKGE